MITAKPLRLIALPCLIALHSLLSCTAATDAAELWSMAPFAGSVFRIDDQTGSLLPGGIPFGSGGIAFPGGITVGPNGDVYVSDQATNQVLFYDGITGSPNTHSAPGSTTGVFADVVDEFSPAPYPAALLFGPDNNLYVAELGGPRIRRFDGTTGAPLPDAGILFDGMTGSNVGGIAFGPDGNLYAGGFSSGAVYRIDGGVATPFVPDDPLLQTPTALLFTPAGDLLVVDAFGNAVHRYNSQGAPQYRFAPSDTNQEHPLPFIILPPEIPENWMELPGVTAPTNSPSGIAFDKDGNLVVSVLGLTQSPPDNRGAIYRYDLNGILIESIISNTAGIGGVAFGWKGTVPVPGDYDGDSFVDEDDYNKWRQDFGKFVAPRLGADGNGNGVVDAADYVIWRQMAGSGSGAALSIAIPEPGTIGSVFLVAFLAAAPRARRR